MASITTQNIGAAASTVTPQAATTVRERNPAQQGLDPRQLNQAQQSQIQKISNQLRPNEQAVIQQNQARVEQNPRTRQDKSDENRREPEEAESEDEVKAKDDRKVHVEA